jgi:hypothetical protein
MFSGIGFSGMGYCGTPTMRLDFDAGITAQSITCLGRRERLDG